MSSQHKQKITDLLDKELRKELENRDMDTTGKKADLVERLKNALQEEGQHPETYLFEDKHAAVISSISKVSGEVTQVSTDITSLENKVSADITSLEHKVFSEILKVLGDISSLESKMTNEISASISKVTSDFDDKISSLKSTL
uniref:Scaffold attachment factor B2-like n=1 Tax=Diabrotica virgifera virgifera TaxID=50390 RepID=A0A6P7FKW6_DIAVI